MSLIGEITKQDVMVFRNSLIKQVSAKTANHDLKALKMMLKSARRDSVITEDPTEFVEPVRRERASKIKRLFTLAELRSIVDLASDEWRSIPKTEAPMSDKVTTKHLERAAYVYIRQSSLHQVRNNQETRRQQYALEDRAREVGFNNVVIIHEDLRISGTSHREWPRFGVPAGVVPVAELLEILSEMSLNGVIIGTQSRFDRLRSFVR